MKVTAVCAGLGAVVGAVLFVALRFVVGQSVLDGLGTGAYDLPRRYVDYVPLHETLVASDFRGFGEMLGVGLAGGALVGLVLHLVAARRPTFAEGRRLAVVLASSSLVLGAAFAVGLHFVTGRITRGADFGWYAQTGDDGVFYGGGPTPSWWPLVVTGALVGLLVGAVAAGGAVWTGRARRA